MSSPTCTFARLIVAYLNFLTFILRLIERGHHQCPSHQGGIFQQLHHCHFGPFALIKQARYVDCQDEYQQQSGQQQGREAYKLFEDDAQTRGNKKEAGEQDRKPRSWYEGSKHSCEKIDHKKMVQSENAERQSKQDPSQDG